MKLEWSDAALADLDRFAAFLDREHPSLAAVVASEIIGKVLPEYADLILDEAHHLEDTATDQLGSDVDQQDLAFFLASLSLAQGPGRYAGLVSRAHTVMMTAGDR